jgi:hypothetical protein
MSSSNLPPDGAPIIMAKYGGVPDSYIVSKICLYDSYAGAPRYSIKVMLKETSDQPAHMRWVKKLSNTYSSPEVLCTIRFEYESKSFSARDTHIAKPAIAFKAYSAKLSGAALEEVARSSDIKEIHQNYELEDYVEPEPVANIVQCVFTLHSAKFFADFASRQGNAAWGLQRISQRDRLPPGFNRDGLNYHYNYDLQAPPAHEVDVYVIDSGVFLGHNDFGGRAIWGTLLEGQTPVDLRGHGTHVAGIIAGTRWGVAKNANIIALKNRADNQLLPDAEYALGCFNWVIAQVDAQNPKRPSIINYSGGSDHGILLDMGATDALAAGVHVCAAAGNRNSPALGVDAGQTRPARVPGVVVVGCTRIDDSRHPQTNFGPTLTIFAPGEHITSAAINNGPDGTARLTGTSPAAPHVSGLMAYILGREGNMTPAALRQRIQDLGVPGVGNRGAGSP